MRLLPIGVWIREVPLYTSNLSGAPLNLQQTHKKQIFFLSLYTSPDTGDNGDCLSTQEAPDGVGCLQPQVPLRGRLPGCHPPLCHHHPPPPHTPHTSQDTPSLMRINTDTFFTTSLSAYYSNSAFSSLLSCCMGIYVAGNTCAIPLHLHKSQVYIYSSSITSVLKMFSECMGMTPEAALYVNHRYIVHRQSHQF